jgi:tyrosyl-tRNA synthetase
MAPRAEKIQNLLTRNVQEAIDFPHLEGALRGGRKLRVKLGIDPTGGNVHIGNAVAFWKLREFQELGHKAVIIIGDFTAQVGDPSDKLSKRPFLTPADIKKNLKNYLPQIGKIIDLKKAEVRYNSEWLKRLTFQEVSRLAELFTIQQMIERRNFKERWQKHEDISLREFMYPLMQGYDSVAVKADVELGSEDQLFNLLAGRKIQPHYGQKPQDILTTRMLSGTDGRKMSKSWGNVINVADAPDEQYGKVMSVRDEVMVEYFELATDMGMDEVGRYKKALAQGDMHPKAVKEKLAFEIVKRYHGVAAAQASAVRFEALFSKGEVIADALPLRLPKRTMRAADVVAASGVTKSKSDAWRLVAQGGLDVAGRAVRDPNAMLTFAGGEMVRVGKKGFFRVELKDKKQ